MEWKTETIEDFKKATEEILDTISSDYTKNGTDNACVVCLHGDLGAGKTTMTQIIGESLGISETINSPTFVIKKTYETSDNIFKTLVHMDAYRLEGEQNLEVFRLDQDFKKPNTLMIIEWPEIINTVIPKDALYVYIEHDGEGRKIIFKKTA